VLSTVPTIETPDGRRRPPAEAATAAPRPCPGEQSLTTRDRGMQLSSLGPVSIATAASAPRAEYSAQGLLPHELQVARIGKGTVQSEVDRTIRVRLEGDGPPSQARLVPDSAAADALLSSPDGPKLDRAIRSFLKVADGHAGKENLNSVTLLPDEHASKAVSVLNWAAANTRAGEDISSMLDPTEYRVAQIRKENPEYSRAQIRGIMRQYAAQDAAKRLSAGDTSELAFSAAWNYDGNIVVMPDVSRDLLTGIGLYRTQPGDETSKLPRTIRSLQARQAWQTVVHETNHSITPLRNFDAPEHTRVFEEAIPEVLADSKIGATVHAAGADLARSALPARDTRHEVVDWPAWNRDHLPKPPADKVETAQGRYFDGPTLVRELLHLAKVDRRTSEGKAATEELLQGQTASRVPKRLADAIVSAQGLPAAKADPLAELIRRVSVGEKSLADITSFLGT
jgi:hypothetical protein